MSRAVLGYTMSGDMRPLYTTGRGHRVMHGQGFFDDVFSGIKSVIGPVIDIAKKTGAVSKLAGAFGQPEIAGVASALGFGKRKKQKGGAWYDDTNMSVRKYDPQSQIAYLINPNYGKNNNKTMVDGFGKRKKRKARK